MPITCACISYCDIHNLGCLPDDRSVLFEVLHEKRLSSMILSYV
jgi:hypothetical protein